MGKYVALVNCFTGKNLIVLGCRVFFPSAFEIFVI